MAWAPPRKISNWSDWEEARSMEESEWKLEPAGEAEVPEIIIVSDVVEGTFVDLDGEGRREQVEAKPSGRRREIPNGEGEEMESPRRKVIQVDFEKKQDYGREAKSTEQEEEGERTLVPSAASVPLEPLCRRANQRSEKTTGFWQLASAVLNEVMKRLRPNCLN